MFTDSHATHAQHNFTIISLSYNLFIFLFAKEEFSKRKRSRNGPQRTSPFLKKNQTKKRETLTGNNPQGSL